MSWIDRYAEYMCRKAGSGNGVVRKVVGAPCVDGRLPREAGAFDGLA